MNDNPWPRVHIDGRLERAEKEWLHTNGAGAYSMSTVATIHTRRYHGLLVASLPAPFQRTSIVSQLETRVVTRRNSYKLSAHQFPGIAPTPGYRLLERFDQDPLPRWTYRLGRVRFERTLCLVRGENAAVLRYVWHGRFPARLFLRPLLSLRDVHSLVREHGGMEQRVKLRPHEIEFQPVADLPSVVVGHNGVFVGSPDWYRRFEYGEDKLRGVECEEDLWTPGTFEMDLAPGEPTFIVFAVARLPSGEPNSLMQASREHLLSCDPGETKPLAIRELAIAADAYCADECERPAIVAGYPWMDIETRDLLLALPGLYLARGRVEAAQRVLQGVVGAERNGFLPRRLQNDVHESQAVAADATLWLFETTRLLLGFVSPDDPFLRHALFPILRRIFFRVSRGPREMLWLTADGLVENGDDDIALTWMDMRTEDNLATPRRGLAVELQSLWSKGAETLSALAHHYGDLETAGASELACRQTRDAFRKRFWCERTKYPYDYVVDGEPVTDEMEAIRPNALIALDVDPSLFEHWQAKAILERVEALLLTPRGVRSLAPSNPAYRGQYSGPFSERRAAYHQGLAWTHLLGCYTRAAMRLHPNDFDLQEELRFRVEKARLDGPVLGHIAQFSDGEPPYAPGGCPAQAWSASELLRTLSWELDR